MRIKADHGTRNKYNYDKCRCGPCRQAQSDHMRAYYTANREKVLETVRRYDLFRRPIRRIERRLAAKEVLVQSLTQQLEGEK